MSEPARVLPERAAVIIANTRFHSLFMMTSKGTRIHGVILPLFLKIVNGVPASF